MTCDGEPIFFSQTRTNTYQVCFHTHIQHCVLNLCLSWHHSLRTCPATDPWLLSHPGEIVGESKRFTMFVSHQIYKCEVSMEKTTLNRFCDRWIIIFFVPGPSEAIEPKYSLEMLSVLLNLGAERIVVPPYFPTSCFFLRRSDSVWFRVSDCHFGSMFLLGPYTHNSY